MHQLKGRLFLILALSLAAPSTLAQPEDTPAPSEQPPPPPGLADSLTGAAKADYDAGRVLYEDGDWAGAKLKFERAYELSKDPRLLWNMAAAEKNLRHYASVLRLLGRYLAEGGDRISADDRQDAHAIMRTVRAFVADLTVSVDQPGAEIFVDDQKLASSPLKEPLQVDMGERRIRVRKAGFVDYSAAHKLPGGEAVTIDVKLVADVHQGTLRVVANEGDAIRIDGKLVGRGQWQGKLASGVHTLSVSAPGKRTFQTDVVVQDNQVATRHVHLEAEASADAGRDRQLLPAWAWITAGAAVAVGVGLGAYLLLNDDDGESATARTIPGTIPPGSIQLGFW